MHKSVPVQQPNW